MTSSGTSSSQAWSIQTDDYADEYATDTRHFRVVAGGRVFAARLTTAPDGEAIVDFAVPARPASIPCMTFLARADLTDVVLNQVHYAEQCSLDGGLKAVGGSRATRDMLRVGCVVANRLLAPLVPGLSTLSFADRSGFLCKEVGEIPLAAHSLLLYGATWYERSLPGVVPYNAELEQRLADARRSLAGPVATPFDAFWVQAFGASIEQARSIRAARDGVAAAYDAVIAAEPHASWNAVFREINRSIGCFLFVHVINTLMRTKGWPLSLDGESWRIDLSRVEAAVSIEPLDGPATGGGSRRPPHHRLRDARRAICKGMEAFQETEARRARDAIAAKRRAIRREALRFAHGHPTNRIRAD